MELRVVTSRHEIVVDSTALFTATIIDAADAAIDPTTLEIQITELGQAAVTKTRALGDWTSTVVGTWVLRHKFTSVGLATFFIEAATPASDSSEVVKGTMNVVAKP